MRCAEFITLSSLHKVLLIRIKVIQENISITSIADRILTANSIWVHFYFLDFRRTTEICIKGKGARYTEFILSVGILKSSVNINPKRLETSQMPVLLVEFWFKIWVEDTNIFWILGNLERRVLREKEWQILHL